MNRRLFLQTSAATLAGVTLLPGHFILSAGAASSATGKIRYDADCFTINGNDVLLYGAEFHYPRCPRELWPDRFLKLQRAGFNYIQTMVFWNWHERSRGVFDFSDLVAFVKMAGEFGFFVSVRPGPYICAEWTRGGFPAWVVAEQFPLRSMDPRSLRSSKYWYDHVLPVIRPLQITQGGPIIAMQIENEIDFWWTRPADKEQYLTYLATLATGAGIDVSLFTNMGKEARDNQNPVMARVIDTLDKYPRWNVDAVTPLLQQLKREEPASPLGLAELEGGWFAQIGGKLSVDQPGVDGAELALLDRHVLAHGVTWFNDYMGFGGTNFEWAAKGLTTTYDYAAPVREPGGLWEKYYEAHGIGQLLGHSGEVLARAQAMAAPSRSSNASIEVIQRARGERSVLFLRCLGAQEQAFKLQVRAGAVEFAVPLTGELRLRPREMKALPVNLPLGEATLLYTTAEVAGTGWTGDRTYVILQEDAGRQVEAAFGMPAEPQLRGEVANASWDARHHAMRVLVEASGDDQTFEIGEKLVLLVTSRRRGLRTWRMSLGAGESAGQPPTLAWITDASLLRDGGQEGNTLWAEFDLPPTDQALTVLMPRRPARVTAGGQPVEPAWKQEASELRMRLIVPPPNIDALPMTDVQYWVDEIATGPGDWSRAPVLPNGDIPAIENLGPVPYGWVKYRSHFNADANSHLEFNAYTTNASRVFVNGRLVAEPAGAKPAKQQKLNLNGLTQPGLNRIEVIYDCFGAANSGRAMQDLTGMASMVVVTPAGARERIGNWQYQLAPAPMQGHNVNPGYVFGAWHSATLGALSREFGEPLAPAFVWVNAPFRLRAPGGEWNVAWRLHVECDRDTLFYLNGHFVGRYATVGPQSDFYLPEPWLHRDGSANVLSAVLAGARRPDHLRVLRVEPYDEWITRRTRIEMVMG